MSKLYDLYKAVGKDNYGAAVAQIAPYFGTIAPEFIELRPGYCELRIRHVRAVENHLGTIHAIAICNGAELAAGVMTDVSIPAEARWIPVGMSVRYLAKARTDVRVIANGEGIDWTMGDLDVPVEAIDADGTKVFDAKIQMHVSRKP